MSIQQTVLRVQTNIPHETITGATQFTTLDLYGDIPIKINKSIAEIQDISKRNSDLSIGLTLPGSKTNNRFFESFYNVDTQSLYFNPTSRVSCDVLLNDQSYFRGYLRLNKINVLNSKVEYDVTLFSSVGNLFGEIGNNLLQDLDFDDAEYTFNHTFTLSGVTNLFGQSNFYKDSEYPYTYFYPIVHNGYEYSSNTINFTGVTSGQTRLYTSTSPIGSWNSYTAATAAGVEEYRINSPKYGLRDNQLKPALNIWSLIQLIFKTYGYSIKSDFMNTPWMKSLYLYGYFSYEGTKFGWKVNTIQRLPPEGVELIWYVDRLIVVKKGTGIPCTCTEDISGIIYLPPYPQSFNIPAGTQLVYVTYGTPLPDYEDSFTNNGVGFAPVSELKYQPKQVGDSQTYEENDNVTFNLVIDQNIKQIDLLGSIAKKFNLVFINDPDISNQIIVEPYDYYIGTGEVYDWTPNLSWDKGFTVEPALNYIESTLLLTDLEDGDEGNREFKNRTNRIYGQSNVYNPTDFKSQDKKIDTIFSPELIRKWDDNIGLPLGINYAATSEIDKVDNQVRWSYKGVKTKPKLFYWVGTANPFIDDVNEVYSMSGTNYNTFTIKVAPSNYTGSSIDSNERIPVVSHTMPLGLADSEKINNDSFSILFNSELPVDIGVQTYNTYTENDAYNTFYRTRINNIYNPNTRVVSGYFDLKYSDVQNLQWNDVIKINEQYFTINKINEFNLNNRELTKVELIQLNLNPQQYVDRYFKYTYCDQPGYCFKLKTDFTNPNLQDTKFIWSTYYDQQVGSLTGSTTGFTSAFRIFNTGSFQQQYVPYTMEEITSTDYASGSCYDSSCDTMLNYIYANPNGLNYSLASFWENASGSFKGTNLWENCSGFSATNSTYGLITGSSVTYGTNLCLGTPTPTPTATPTPTPTATPTATPTVTPTPVPYGTCYDFNYYINDTFFDSQNRLLTIGSFTTYTGITANQKLAFNTGLTIDSSFDHTCCLVSYENMKLIQEFSDGTFVLASLNGGRNLGLYGLLSGGTYNTGFTSGYFGNGEDCNLRVYKTKDVFWSHLSDSSAFNNEFTLILNRKDNSNIETLYDANAIIICSDMTTDGSYVNYNNYSGLTKFNLDYSGSTVTGFSFDTSFSANTSSYTYQYRQIVADTISDKFYVFTDLTNQIYRFNNNGTIDSTFTFTGFTYNSRVNNALGILTVDSNGKLLITTETTMGVTIPQAIIRLNTNGSIDNTFNYGIASAYTGYSPGFILNSAVEISNNAYAISVQNGQQFPIDAVGKMYYNTGGSTRLINSLFVLNNDGTLRDCPSSP